MGTLETRLTRLETAMQAEGPRDPPELTDAERARLLADLVARGWLVRNAGGWEGCDPRTARLAQLLNDAEARREEVRRGGA